MRNRNKAKCIICEKEIKTKQETFGNRAWGGKCISRRCSDEGVFFTINENSGKWFCNSCWEEVRK